VAAFTGNSIVGQVVAGDGHVVSSGQHGLVSGPTSAGSFGSLAFRVTLGSGGVLSAQAFGAVTPKPRITITISGRGTAQAFGTVIAFSAGKTGVVGLASAQGFGAPSFKTTVTRTVTGLGSAQGFGAVTITTRITRTVAGLGSAQSFGSLYFRVTLGSGGVLSAQAFGVVTPSRASPQTVQVQGLAPLLGIRSIVGGVISGDGHLVGGTDFRFGLVSFALGGVKVTVGGVGSPQSFGHPGIAQYVQVDGVQPPPEVRSIVGQVISGDGHLVGGYNLRFGFITIRTATRVQVAGVGSAQSFGAPHIAFWQPLPVAGIPSAGLLGVPLVFKVWVRPFDCGHLDLTPISCTDLALVENGQGEFVLVGASVSTIDLTASSEEEIDLQPVGCD
jgi:hypothetical protein